MPSIRFLDISAAGPAANLALDEALLDSAEAGASGATLRLWESPAPFVVLGSAQAVHEETWEEACRNDGVPILRRCSAGGCVLQGPGCLNFSLILTFAGTPEVRSLHESYQYILGRIVDTFAARQVHLAIEGICDLALDGKKVSGNAQRRRRHAILHHGTLLYRVDSALLDRYIREPSQRPAYRGVRSHSTFVGTLPATAETLREWVRAAFGAAGPAAELLPRERDLCERLVREKYEDAAWNYRR